MRKYEKDFMVYEVNCLPQMSHSIYAIFMNRDYNLNVFQPSHSILYYLSLEISHFSLLTQRKTFFY